MSDAEVNIRILDAAYRPFPTFEEWAAQTSVDTVRWERYRSSLQAHAEPRPEVLARAREIAKRAAALDTGAIEGLYEVDRGFTYTVAFETSAWEAALAQKGEHVRSGSYVIACPCLASFWIAAPQHFGVAANQDGLYQVIADHQLRGFAKFAIERGFEETRLLASDFSA